LPVNPVPVKGALVQLENGVRTYLRIEFPEPPSPDLDPTTGDWTLQIFDTPEVAALPPNSTLQPARAALAKNYLLASSGWSQGPTGTFTYSGAGGAVTAEVDERTFLLKATGAEAMANVEPANEVGALLKIGGVEYYALIGGKVSSNVAVNRSSPGPALVSVSLPLTVPRMSTRPAVLSVGLVGKKIAVESRGCSPLTVLQNCLTFRS
jgi:hypothetical protein